MLLSRARQWAPNGAAQVGEQATVYMYIPVFSKAFQLHRALFMSINNKLVCWHALITMLVLLSCSAPRATSCWNIRFWLRNEEFVDLHDVAAHHVRARRIAPSPSVITPQCLRVDPTTASLPQGPVWPKALCGGGEKLPKLPSGD